MSDRDIFINNNWPFSPISQDDSSIDSLPCNTSNPSRNPYHTPPNHICQTLTKQQLYNATNWATQPSIMRWLWTHWQTLYLHQDPQLNYPTTKLRTKWQLTCTIQPPLHQLLTNNHWGDAPTTYPINFWVISKNANLLSTAEHNLQWHGAIQAMLELDAHVLCVQEQNLKWTDNIKQLIYHLFQKAFMHTKISTSKSIDTQQSTYQLNGTFLVTLGCYAARVTTVGHDTTGMGWWTYHKLIGQWNNWYLIISVYWVGPQCPTIGTHTAYMQQYNILLLNNDLSPDPREQFVTDMIAFLHQWQDTHDILLCLDANNNTTDSRDKGIKHIIDETAIIYLQWYCHPHLIPPATYAHGSCTIDYCLGTPGFANALKATWMLPFGLPPTLSGNHCTLRLEFDHDICFGQKVSVLMNPF